MRKLWEGGWQFCGAQKWRLKMYHDQRTRAYENITDRWVGW